MSFNSFIPSIWIAKLLPILRNRLSFKTLTNADYEGAVKEKGDSVIINQVSTPSIGDYTDANGVTWEALSTADQTLLIDQAKYFSFYVSDIDKAQSANGGALMAEGIKNGGYALNNVVDIAIAAQYAYAGIKGGSITASKLGTTGTPLEITIDGGGTSVKISDWLGRMARRAKEGNMPDEVPKSIVIPPWLEQKMVTDKIITNRGVNNDGTYAEGTVRSAYGFNFEVSNNVNVTSSTKYNVMGGNRNSITLADQITHLEALRREDYFQDSIKSLYVYGIKTVRADQLILSVLTEGAEGQG